MRFAITLAIGVGVICTRIVKRHPIVCVAIVALIVSSMAQGRAKTLAHNSPPMTRAMLTEYVQNNTGGIRQLMQRVTVLERACVARNSQGGVTTCLNPNARDLAFAACIRNDAYTFTRSMLIQCMDDYYDMMGWN